MHVVGFVPHSVFRIALLLTDVSFVLLLSVVPTTVFATRLAPVSQLPAMSPGTPKAWEYPGSALWSSHQFHAVAAGGNLRHLIPLFAWSPPGVGPRIEVGIVQNSADKNLAGPIGNSVRLFAAATLTVQSPTAVVLIEADGTTRAFNRSGIADYVGELFDFDRVRPTPSGGYQLLSQEGFKRIFSPGSTGIFLETARIDRVQDKVTFSYNAADQLIRISDSADRSAIFDYASGVCNRITSPAGHVVELRYQEGFLIQIDGNNLMAGEERLNLNLYWDGQKRQLLGRSNWSGGPGAVFTYDDQNRVTSIKGYDGDIRSFVYMSDHVQLQSINGTAKFLYRNGSFVEIIGVQGRSHKIERDEKKRPIGFVDSFGKTTVHRYDDNDNLISIQDPGGRLTAYEYDEEHRVIKKTDPFGQQTTYTYNTFDQLLQRTDASGDVTSYQYDEFGNLMSITDFAGVIRFQATYGSNGEVLTVTNAIGHTTSYAYDPSTQWSTITAPDGRRTSRTVNPEGTTQILTTSNDHTIRFGYDKLGRRTRAQWNNLGPEEVTYNSNGAMVSHSDRVGPRSQEINVEWSSQGQVNSNSVNGKKLRIAAPAR